MFKKSDCFAQFFFFFLLLLVSSSAFAQKQITGKVINPENNQPIAGASVQVKGTAVGTQTAADGSFAISTSATNPTLVVSSVGFEQQEIRPGNQNNLTVSLRSSASALSEVVVTGYTAQRKKEITGAVAVVKTGDLTKVAAPSFAQQLEGRASGITTTSSGAPGSGVSLRIRGNSTFTEGGGDPLIVVDGLQIRGANLNQINPNDIESIQILKDAATTASYGIGANNGVVIITTKRGKTGQPRVDASSYYGIQSPGGRTYGEELIWSSAEYAEYLFQSYNNAGLWPLKPDDFISRVYGTGPRPVLPEYVNPLPAVAGGPINTTYNYPNNLVMKASPGTNWWDVAFRNDAPITEHNLSVSGGAGNTGRYFFSVNYFNQEGIMRYTDYRKYSVRGNTEFKVKGFTFGENLSVTFNNQVNQPGGNQLEQNIVTQGIVKNQPIIPVYDEGGNWGGTKAGFGGGDNALARLFRNKDNRQEGMRLFGNVYGEIAFLNHFSARISYGIDHGWDFGKNYNFTNIEANQIVGSGFSEFTNRFYNWIFQQQLNYSNEFGDHNLRLTGVHEARLNTFRNMSGSLAGFNIETPNLWYLNTAFGSAATRQVNSSGGTNNARESYLGRVEYGFKGKYLVNATARYDQSSNFAADKGQVFGGLGFAWRVSDENFMRTVDWINDLKIRAAYGVTGSDAIPPTSNYSFFGGGIGTTFYDMNGTNNSVTTGYAQISAGEPVKWEKQKQVNIGVDAVFARNRLDVSIDVYNRTNSDFLFRPGLPGTFPYLVTAPFRNLGSISNKGVEMSLNWKDAIARNIRYDVGLNLTLNRNRIDELAPELGVTNFFGSTPESRIGPLVRHEQGQPMGTFYGYTVAGIFETEDDVAKSPTQDGAAVGRFKWKDLNNDGKIDNIDKGVIGNPNPDLVYGINLGLSYKNFDFTMFLQGSLGNENFNYTKYFTDFHGFTGTRSKRMLYESWTPTRTNAILPLLNINDATSMLPSSYYVEDASYLRARSIQFGYKLPARVLSRLKIDNTRIYVQAQNLFTITKYLGLDPTLGTRNDATEQWAGIDFGNYPTARSFMVGINLSF